MTKSQYGTVSKSGRFFLTQSMDMDFGKDDCSASRVFGESVSCSHTLVASHHEEAHLKRGRDRCDEEASASSERRHSSNDGINSMGPNMEVEASL